MLWNEECYVQLETCSFQLQIFRQRKDSLTLKEIKTERIRNECRGGGSGQRNKGERERTVNSSHYLKLSSLSPSSLPVMSVKTSESNQKTLSSPEVLLSLSVSILYSKNLNFKAWNKEHHQYSRCSALFMHTQVRGWSRVICDHAGPQSITCYFNYSWGKDRKSHRAHSVHLTALHLWHPGPSHCLWLCDLHNQTQNPNEGDLSLIIDLITIFLKFPVNKLKTDIFKVQDFLILLFQN